MLASKRVKTQNSKTDNDKKNSQKHNLFPKMLRFVTTSIKSKSHKRNIFYNNGCLTLNGLPGSSAQ